MLTRNYFLLTKLVVTRFFPPSLPDPYPRAMIVPKNGRDAEIFGRKGDVNAGCHQRFYCGFTI
jgi:hypothetical protein